MDSERKAELTDTSSLLAWVRFSCDKEKEEKVSKGS